MILNNCTFKKSYYFIATMPLSTAGAAEMLRSAQKDDDYASQLGREANDLRQKIACSCFLPFFLNAVVYLRQCC